ncbi:MAG: hypothetical protein AVDCRST_MAG52-1218 [uncultured Blastococcus sp.]|uniref:Uncharacterized protein n=1 Tax=uncultured Blastococcus sp. TaxID=217144 RepID=A0A6J4HUM1_9ACTN|nr:MAG: hypothetical protein AVDCRST_MAG52-1218 [uncultured Blastococcus sp.]
MSMAGPHGSDPDDGMASGWDADQSGGHLGPGDLDPDEERLLAALERDSGGPREPRGEESPPRARAAEAPRQPRGGPPDDGLTPVFAEPDLDERPD